MHKIRTQTERKSACTVCVCEREREREREGMIARLYVKKGSVNVRAYIFINKCMCACERERERERERGTVYFCSCLAVKFETEAGVVLPKKV